MFNIAGSATKPMWRKFVGIIGRPEPGGTHDPSPGPAGHRIKHLEALTADIYQALAAHLAQYWIQFTQSRRDPGRADSHYRGDVQASQPQEWDA